MEIQSVIVEGGQMLLQSFIDAKLWDEARDHYGEHPVVVSAEDGSLFNYEDVDLLILSTQA